MLNVAVVANALGLPNVTVPGPDNLLHVVVKVPDGSPSSDAVPESETDKVGRFMLWSVPALTVGAELTLILVVTRPTELMAPELLFDKRTLAKVIFEAPELMVLK